MINPLSYLKLDRTYECSQEPIKTVGDGVVVIIKEIALPILKTLGGIIGGAIVVIAFSATDLLTLRPQYIPHRLIIGISLIVGGILSIPTLGDSFDWAKACYNDFENIIDDIEVDYPKQYDAISTDDTSSVSGEDN